MADAPIISYGIGLKESQFETAAHLYDEAFGEKFKVAIKSRTDGMALLESTFVGSFALTASEGKDLVGLAGFHTREGSLTSGIGASQLLSKLGMVRGFRAIVIFSLYERTPKPGELVMDGIAVHKDYRGHGIGSQLLNGIVSHAKEEGFDTVRLDVIDTNPGAKRLYERSGFVPTKVERFPYLRWLLGFGASTTMEFRIADAT